MGDDVSVVRAVSCLEEGLVGYKGCMEARFSEIDLPGFVTVVKASFYRQMRRQILFQIGKEYSKDNDISI